MQFEVYAVAPGAPQRLWELVGDPSRFHEWTDADVVEGPPEPPHQVGQRFATVDGGRRRGWVVITTDERLLEIKTDDTDCGRLGIGIRVAGDPLGARLILAGLLDPVGTDQDRGGSAGQARRRALARLVHVPRTRARFDRWSARAVRAVTGQGG